ncbi:MAG: hypothetical protein PWP08_1102 [Methanofollis sp.]|nr:hypothetical protein [Methanofollis sp.]
MKRIGFLMLCLLCLFLAGQASAAQVYLTVPSSVNVGQPLDVTGTTNGVSPGYAFDVVFYHASGSKSELTRQQVVSQKDGTFSVTFSTDGLKSGQYSIEVQEEGSGIFGSTKKPVIFDIVNRTADLTVSSPLTQSYDGTLRVAGSIKNYGNEGVQLEVKTADGDVVFSPQYIATSAGVFSRTVPISSGGMYVVEIMDNTSYVWTVEYTVTGGLVPTVITTSSTTTSSSEGPTYSASAVASRAAPAYFTVKTLGGPVTITTSSGIDWVLDYIDENGVRTTVNNQGTSAPERVTFQARGGTVYVKVAPQLYTTSGSVVLTASNVASVAADASVAAKFGDQVPTTTQESPVPFWTVPVALGVFFLLRRR